MRHPRLRSLFLVVFGILLLGGGSFLGPNSISKAGVTGLASALVLESDAFLDGGDIPREYTCEGPDKSPELHWDGVPYSTESYALIMDDPDAPDPANPRDEPFVHWVLYDIPKNVRTIPKGKKVKGAGEGTNDFGKASYGGPCPPIGEHRYFFQLYALDVDSLVIINVKNPTKDDVLRAMNGHVLAIAELVGLYEKNKK